MMQPNQPTDKPTVKPFVNFPNGLYVIPWGDGVMFGVVDQNTKQGVSSYLGREGIERLFAWLIASNIVHGEIHQEAPSEVMVQWPGPKPDAN